MKICVLLGREDIPQPSLSPLTVREPSENALRTPKPQSGLPLWEVTGQIRGRHHPITLLLLPFLATAATKPHSHQDSQMSELMAAVSPEPHGCLNPQLPEPRASQLL